MTINTSTAIVPFGFGEHALSDLNQEGMRQFEDSPRPKDNFKFLGYFVPPIDQRYGPSGYLLAKHHSQGTHVDIYV